MLIFAMPLAQPPQTTATRQTPEAFVRSIYSHYQSKMPNYNGKGAEAIFSPSLLQLIRKNGTSGFIGYLDVDPVCSCNEIDGLSVDRIAISQLTKDHAIATVSLSFGNAVSQTLHFMLISGEEGWRVDDISSAVVNSLRKRLATR